jgi:hypothetical protein
MTKKIAILPPKIRRNTILAAGKTYVVEGEVHVVKGARLTMENQVTILLVNGVFPKSALRRSALIFDQGSSLSAKRLYVKAAGPDHRPVKHANNGGLWFLGNYRSAAKDGLSVRVNRRHPLSSFRATVISTAYLGRDDSYISPKSGHRIDTGDDVDGFSILGVGPEEWAVSEIRSHHSADDGLDVTNSHIRLDRLEIKHPVEDGLNVSSSRVEIHKRLRLDVPKTTETDRDLFDLESDEGASYIELHRRCWVRMNGVFGDQVILSSTEMPKPATRDENECPYSFSGRLKSAALVYSIDKD